MLRLVAIKEKGAKMADFTVLVPTSPIPSNPSLDIINETIDTIRTHTDNEIVIMIDGVRDEQQNLKENYTEFTRRLLAKCHNDWENVTPLLFEEHMHQSGMTRKALQLVKTPQILFVEHDTPITPDREIPFDKLSKAIESGKANLIRLHHEALILDVHKYLMIGESENDLSPTIQWSQRPHLASTEFYKKIVNEYIPLEAKTMIEDCMYSKLEEAYRHRGKVGWNDFKVWIYTPKGDIKRSYHTDGREGMPKFEETFGI